MLNVTYSPIPYSHIPLNSDFPRMCAGRQCVRQPIEAHQSSNWTHAGDGGLAVEEQPSGQIGQPLRCNQRETVHQFTVFDGTTIEQELACDLSGTACSTFLRHEKARTILRAGRGPLLPG